MKPLLFLMFFLFLGCAPRIYRKCLESRTYQTVQYNVVFKRPMPETKTECVRESDDLFIDVDRKTYRLQEYSE